MPAHPDAQGCENLRLYGIRAEPMSLQKRASPLSLIPSIAFPDPGLPPLTSSLLPTSQGSRALFSLPSQCPRLDAEPLRGSQDRKCPWQTWALGCRLLQEGVAPCTDNAGQGLHVHVVVVQRFRSDFGAHLHQQQPKPAAHVL